MAASSDGVSGVAAPSAASVPEATELIGPSPAVGVLCQDRTQQQGLSGRSINYLAAGADRLWQLHQEVLQIGSRVGSTI